MLAAAAFAAPAAALDAPSGTEFFKHLAKMEARGSLSLNWRNVGPRTPGFEVQIQNEVYLADMYFGFDGPFVDGVPIGLEIHLPTAGQGKMQLNQAYFQYRKVDKLVLEFGKFLVPFARYNELYRADQFLTVTRPLLYASPDSLDLVIRNNSPRPPVSSGYTDIGARASYYPESKMVLVPQELTFFVVNGLGENNNRQRTFPSVDFLGIPPVPGNGTNIDFGHQNNNLADNNNAKSFGGRFVWALGDVRLPWPIPEGAMDLQGFNLGLSGMGGQYDLEGALNYQIYTVDWSFDYFGLNISGEYAWSVNDFKVPITTNSINVAAPTQQRRQFEINHGYFIQAYFPLWRHPPVGRRITGVLVFNQLYRRGPILDLLRDETVGTETFPALNAVRVDAPRTSRRIDKYTAALNYQLSEHFFMKFEYSYWVMGRSSTRSATSAGLVDIYQGATSLVMAF